MKRIALIIAGIGAALLLWPETETINVAEDETPRSQYRALASSAEPVSAARSPAASGSVPTPDDQSRRVKKLLALQACYESRTCNFPETDPRSYEIALGKEIASELKEFQSKYKNLSQGRENFEKLARDFMRGHDGFVQEVAIEMLSELPPSAENLMALTEGLQNNADPSLLKQALPAFERYLGTPQEGQVHGFLSATISTGAHFTSEALSESISPFINDRSLEYYEKAKETMPAGSQALTNLNAALLEYRRLKTGA